MVTTCVASRRRDPILLDKSQRTEKYSADFVAHAGIPTFIDAVHAVAHNKVVVIDGETVVTGSFNFTKAAEDRNAENLLAIHDKAIAEQYQKNWKAHRVLAREPSAIQLRRGF